jgi:hypothetical protein
VQELTEIGAALKRHEGCNVYGWMEVARVAGNIHFAVRPEALFLSMNAEEIMAALRQRQVMLHGTGADVSGRGGCPGAGRRQGASGGMAGRLGCCMCAALPAWGGGCGRQPRWLMAWPGLA